MRQNSRLLLVCGPSGTGKSTLLRKLFDEYPDKFGFSVSHTTRSPRRFETDGQHYHFVTKDQMQAAIDRGEFLEHAVFSNNMYGTRYNVYYVILSLFTYHIYLPILIT